MKTNKILYQWDAGQKLTDCRGVFVDFVISGEVYRCDVVNGECIVPDELLQHPGNQTAYECMADNTLQEFVFSVVPRPLPPDYVYTPTEKLTFEGLVQKVNDTVADIIRRADSGEFDGADGHTPVKGTDYFTKSEIQQIQNEVSEGAIGDFKQVVDSETAAYDANAKEKLSAYDANAEAKLNDYNSNAESKVEAYNQNATNKTADYNANADSKLSEYNTNVDNKVAEFNLETGKIQTDIANKLPKSPNNWDEWTAEEQAMARVRMGADGGEMELVADVTTTEDVDVISVDKFSDGTPLKLKSFYLYFVIPKASKDDYIISGYKFKYDNERRSDDRNCASKLISSTMDSHNNMYVLWNNARPIGFVPKLSSWINGSESVENMIKFNNEMTFNAEYVCEVHLLKYKSSIQIPAGTRLQVWGVRA